jgi:hypothetical protein
MGMICPSCNGKGTDEGPCLRCGGSEKIDYNVDTKKWTATKKWGTGIIETPREQWIPLEKKTVEKPKVSSIGPYKYVQQAIMDLQKMGIPIKLEDSMAKYGETRRKGYTLGLPTKIKKKLKKEEVVPLSAPTTPSTTPSTPEEVAIAPPVQISPTEESLVKKEKKPKVPKLLDVVPLKLDAEQNPVGLIESVVAGIAAGAASGAVVAGTNAITNRRKKRGG